MPLKEKYDPKSFLEWVLSGETAKKLQKNVFGPKFYLLHEKKKKRRYF